MFPHPTVCFLIDLALKIDYNVSYIFFTPCSVGDRDMKKMLLITALCFLFSNIANAYYTPNSVIETKAGEPLFDKCIHPIIIGSIGKSNRCFDNEYNPLNATVKAYRYNYLKYERQLYFIGTFVDGYLNGEVIIYKTDGSRNVFNFKDHKLNGTAELYDNFGRIRKIINFADGFMDGKITDFDEDGKKTVEVLYSKGRQFLNPKYYDKDGKLKIGLYKNNGDTLTMETAFALGNLFKLTTYKDNGDLDTQINMQITELRAEKDHPVFKATFGFCHREITNSLGKKEVKKIEFNPMHLYKINSLGIIQPCATFGGIDHGI